jgi:predicted HTH domain antitoxin
MTIQVPDALEREHDEITRLIAAKLYEAGKLTLKQAADICQMKKLDFAEILIKYNVHYLDESATEDLETFRLAYKG